MIAFGPVPSRRLGHSLGINNIPPKTCTYSCVYCQLGRTHRMQMHRQPFYDPRTILCDVRDKVKNTCAAGASIDYLTFVPDVREDLAKADWVSLKVDAVSEDVWRAVDRPHGTLRLAPILEGMLAFARAYQGKLVTETMLVRGINDSPRHMEEIAVFLAQLAPERAYLAIPTRPPAEEWVRVPAEKVLNHAYQILNEKVEQVEYLIGYEGNAFASTGDVAQDLLSITSVHPMREDAMRAFLARAESNWVVIDRLLEEDQLVETRYRGHRFFLRRLGRRDKNQ